MTNGNIDELKQKLQNKLSGISMKKISMPEKAPQIKEKEILELREILKNDNINVEDFLGTN